jgi:hypothetical protein
MCVKDLYEDAGLDAVESSQIREFDVCSTALLKIMVENVRKGSIGTEEDKG